MDRYASLLEVAGLLLAEDGADGLAEAILDKLLATSNGDRGFIVVRDDRRSEGEFEVRFHRGTPTTADRRFSRRLVRHVIESGQTFLSQDVLSDSRLERFESLVETSARAALVVPLRAGAETYGVVYLERTSAGAEFAADVATLIDDLASLAGLSLKRAIVRDELERRTKSLEGSLSSQNDFAGITTRDDAMVALLKMVTQVARSDVGVLVTGETGTGKELIARALHLNSPRARHPYVTLHSTALPPTLLESELFGHVRGAFTGAERDRAGRVTEAHRGTLFLDEVAEIPPELQAKLLRFLQFGEVQRLGSNRVEKVDVRIVAATHRDLRALVADGKFREDLYYRLKVVELALPPLRERRDDIPLLVETFLRRPARGMAARSYFSSEAMRFLAAHDYPGNVRELEHIVERARVLATGPELGVELLPPEVVCSDDAGATGEPASTLAGVRNAASRAAERDYLKELLERCSGNISQAAREAGIPRSYVQRLMTKHGLRRA